MTLVCCCIFLGFDRYIWTSIRYMHTNKANLKVFLIGLVGV